MDSYPIVRMADEPAIETHFALLGVFFCGGERMRLPVTTKMALATARAIGGVPASPNPAPFVAVARGLRGPRAPPGS